MKGKREENILILELWILEKTGSIINLEAVAKKITRKEYYKFLKMIKMRISQGNILHNVVLVKRKNKDYAIGKASSNYAFCEWIDLKIGKTLVVEFGTTI